MSISSKHGTPITMLVVHIIYNFHSKFLVDPPEPLSLRLSSNLMVGVTRIYGQLWNCYQGDVSELLAHMSAFRHSKSVDMPIQKAPIETITLSNAPQKEVSLVNPLEMLEALNLDIFNDMNFNFGELPKTPEQARRLTAASASSTRPPSIDVGRGGLFNSHGTSLSGAEPIIGTQFEANDDDMNYYGFGYLIFLSYPIQYCLAMMTMDL